MALPEFPSVLRYLWNHFLRLRNRRSSGGFGSNPISWQDLVFYQQLSGALFRPWEVEIIEDLDNLDRSEQVRSQRANSQSSPTS